MWFFRSFTIFLFPFFMLSCNNSKGKQGMVENHLERPNVILVMTDDQGIGDLGAHGNPWIKTPNIDQFYEEAVRLTDFHVSPMCTPTRSTLMTGLYPINNGVWATFKGRDMLHPTTIILPEVFKENGYKTAMFGKWHLGNNYPSRPTDRGFDVAIHHSSGGVGELSDYWGNNYFNDTYLVNNQPKKFEGYCTDVWFNEAIKFIKDKKEEPFFVYLPTNAPHHPLYVEKKYAAPYDSLVNNKINSSEFYGMISNIDENFGKLDSAIKELGLADNTIVIFMTDNGNPFKNNENQKLGWNKGFRGKKGEKLEGGHRVPFFIRWPNGSIEGGKDIPELTSHVDLLPTLAGLCNLKLPASFQGDGADLSKVLLNKTDHIIDRTQFLHHRQDYRQPKPIQGSCVMKGQWRLLNGKQLYNIKLDPEQLNNVADANPEIVNELLEQNKYFIANAVKRKEYQEFAYTAVGSEYQQKAKLTIQHAIGDDGPIWKQEEIAMGIKNKNATHPISILKKGKYRISCMRWPEENPGTIQGIPVNKPKGLYDYKRIGPQKARISLFGNTWEKDVSVDDQSIVFELELNAGKTLLEAHFIEGSEVYGINYIYLEKVDQDE